MADDRSRVNVHKANVATPACLTVTHFEQYSQQKVVVLLAELTQRHDQYICSGTNEMYPTKFSQFQNH